MENQPFDREPDIDTPAFKMWISPGTEPPPGEPLLKIDISSGEAVHEMRQYAAILPGYEILILSKRKGEQYWYAIEGKRRDGSSFLRARCSASVDHEGYLQFLKKFEDRFRIFFNVDNPRITPGRHFMLYAKKKEKPHGE